MSGQKEFSAVIDEILKYLNEYESGLGIQYFRQPNNIEEILNLDKAQLESLSAEDCGIYSIILAQYSTYLQKVTNEKKRIVNWCTANVDNLLGNYYNQYSGSFTERRVAAVNENPKAKELQQKIRKYQLEFDSLIDLSKAIQYWSKSMSDLQQTKRYKNVAIRTN